MGILDRILRAGEGKKLKALQGMVPDINALEPEMQRLDVDALQAKTGEFRQRLANGADLDDIAIEAFAVVREAAQRTIGQRHFDVQLMGGAALHKGGIAEMRTGEGKTLVSTLPGYLNALEGEGVQVDQEREASVMDIRVVARPRRHRGGRGVAPVRRQQE